MQAKKILIIISCIALALMLAFLLVPGTGLVPPGPQKPTVYILYSTAGSMPQLLNTDQVDAFFVWQPYVAMARQGGIGKAIVYSEDLPPNHLWADAPCCVFVMGDIFMEREPALAASLSILTTAGIQYINDHPARAEQVTANWIFGDSDILIAGTYLNPLSIEEESLPTLRFTNVTPPRDPHDVSLATNRTRDRPWFHLPGSITPLTTRSGVENESRYRVIPRIRFGYVMSDHAAPLFVLASDPAYFQEHYQLALVPVNPGISRPYRFNLVSGNTTLAEVQLVPGQSGGALMTEIGQDSVDAAYLGSTPASLQIQLGNPAGIIQPLHTGGSALVVANTAPCSDWTNFTAWARERSAAKRPVLMATVQSSVQETMIREALGFEGFDVRLYGT